MYKAVSSRLLMAVFMVGSVATTPCARAAPQDPVEEPNRILARAFRLQQAGDMEGAIREYKSFFAQGAESAGVRSNLGAAYSHLGRYEEAIEQYRRALALEEGNPAFRFNLGVAYYKSGQIPRAADQFKMVVEGQSSNYNAVLLLADCHFRMGRNRQVIELLSPLERVQGENRAVLYLLGTALIREQQVERGQILIDRILRQGESAEAHLMLGTAYLEARELPSALEEFQRAVELNPRLPQVHSLHGRTLMSTGNPPAAVAAFHRELENNPTDFDANLYLGILLKQERRFEEAIPYLNRALLLRPGAPEVRYQLGSLYLTIGNLEEAQSVLEELVQASPKFVEAHVSLATIYYRLKRKADGDRHREIVRKLNEEIQARAPGASEELGPGYRGGATTDIPQARREEAPSERREAGPE